MKKFKPSLNSSVETLRKATNFWTNNIGIPNFGVNHPDCKSVVMFHVLIRRIVRMKNYLDVLYILGSLSRLGNEAKKQLDH